MNRRTALISTLALTLMPKAAFARLPFRLGDDPVPLLSPPFTDGAGCKLELADFAGRVVLLNIWAAWSPPCHEEMPALDAMQRALGGPISRLFHSLLIGMAQTPRVGFMMRSESAILGFTGAKRCGCNWPSLHSVCPQLC